MRLVCFSNRSVKRHRCVVVELRLGVGDAGSYARPLPDQSGHRGAVAILGYAGHDVIRKSVQRDGRRAPIQGATRLTCRWHAAGVSRGESRRGGSTTRRRPDSTGGCTAGCRGGATEVGRRGAATAAAPPR